LFPGFGAPLRERNNWKALHRTRPGKRRDPLR